MAYRLTDLSEQCISYLALSGRNIATASREEKDLCQALLTRQGQRTMPNHIQEHK
jgi:hypothetical protein